MSSASRFFWLCPLLLVSRDRPCKQLVQISCWYDTVIISKKICPVSRHCRMIVITFQLASPGYSQNINHSLILFLKKMAEEVCGVLCTVCLNICAGICLDFVSTRKLICFILSNLSLTCHRPRMYRIPLFLYLL